MEHKITWVTSFNERIYKSSGQRLLASFLNMAPDGKMFVAHEGFDDNVTSVFSHHESLWYYNLGTTGEKLHPMLLRFLKRNKDIIPEEAGGTSKPCECTNDRKHKQHCHYSWWNRHHFRWYRKFVSLQHAVKTFPKTDYLIWIDSDCYFKAKNLTSNFIHDVLFEKDSKDCFYLKGPDREIMEAGLVGYNLKKDNHGLDLLEQILRCYESGKYRALQRWDDSYIIQKFLRDNFYHKHDIAGRKGAHAEVFSKSLIGKFIHHNKGQHGRVEGIFK